MGSFHVAIERQHQWCNDGTGKLMHTPCPGTASHYVAVLSGRGSSAGICSCWAIKQAGRVQLIHPAISRCIVQAAWRFAAVMSAVQNRLCCQAQPAACKVLFASCIVCNNALSPGVICSCSM